MKIEDDVFGQTWCCWRCSRWHGHGGSL